MAEKKGRPVDPNLGDVEHPKFQISQSERKTDSSSVNEAKKGCDKGSIRSAQKNEYKSGRSGGLGGRQRINQGSRNYDEGRLSAGSTDEGRRNTSTRQPRTRGNKEERKQGRDERQDAERFDGEEEKQMGHGN